MGWEDYVRALYNKYWDAFDIWKREGSGPPPIRTHFLIDKVEGSREAMADTVHKYGMTCSFLV